MRSPTRQLNYLALTIGVLALVLLARADAATAALQVNFTNTSNTDSAFATTFQSNLTPFHLYGCLGVVASCDSSQLSNTVIWNDFGTTSIPNGLSATVNGLRPARTYTYNIYATSGAETATNSTQFTTWPGYGFTPTDVDAGCDGVTKLCKRTISWTTPFDSFSRVLYSTTPPAWTNSYSDPYTIEDFRSSVALPTGEAWSVGYFSTIIYRSPSGTWTTLPNQDPLQRHLLSIDMVDNKYGWIVGSSGLTMRTLDGQSWAIVPPPSGFSSYLRAVISPSQDVAWAFGDGESILSFDANSGSWVKKTFPGQDASLVIWSAASIDGKLIVAGGVKGRILRTQDGGTNWTVSSIGSTTEDISTLTTTDNHVFWAGGIYGTLWRSVDSGNTWTIVRSITGTILSITQQSPTVVKFIAGDSVYAFDPTSQVLTRDNSMKVVLGLNPYTISSITSGLGLAMAGNKVAEYAVQSATPQTDIYLTQNHSLTLSGLAPSIPYYYYASSTGAGIISGSMGSFTTPALDTIPPTVSINPVPAYVKTCPLTISGAASDTAPGTVQSVTVTLGGNPPVTIPAAAASPTWSTTFSCAQLATASPIAKTVTAVANDGTNDSTPATANFVFDNAAPSVAISAPATVTTPTVTATGTASDNDQVAKVEISVNGLLPRINASVTAAGTGVTWTAGNLALSPGLNTLTAYATDRAGNEASTSTNVTYNVPTFAISADPPTSQTLPAGTTALFPIKVAAVDGYVGDVVLSLQNPPSGLNVLLSGYRLSLTATVGADYTTVIVGSTPGAGSGPYPITVAGSYTDPFGALVTKTTQVTLTLTTTPDFSLSVASASSQTVVAGQSTTYTMSINGSSTYVYDPSPGISWSTGALPTGVTASFGSLTGNPGGSGTATAILTLATTSQVPASTQIDVTASDGAKTHTARVWLTATPPPDFTIAIAPPSAAVTAGSGPSAAYNATVTAINNFTGPVNLTISTNPSDSNVTAIFSANDFVPTAAGTSVTVNISVGTAVQCLPPGPCNFALSINATSGAATKTATATLIITPDTTAPIISSPSASPSANQVTISWLTDELANSHITIYADATQNDANAFGTQNDLAFTTAHTITYPGLLPTTTYYYSITSVDQAQPSGNSATMKINGGGPLQFTTPFADDNIPPRISITQPAGGTDVLGTAIITVTGIDNNAMSLINFKITATGATTPLVDTQFSCPAGNSCDFSYQWNTLSGPVPNGAYDISAQAVSTRGPANISPWTSVNVNVNNDTQPPQMVCLSGQTICGPAATGLTCAAGKCQIDIHWKTNKLSTSEVEYGTSTDCTQRQTRPDGTSVLCTYPLARAVASQDNRPNPADTNPIYTDHLVTLYDLLPDELYHYRITSCNASNYCTN